MSLCAAPPAKRIGSPGARKTHSSYGRWGMAAAFCGLALFFYWLINLTSDLDDEQDQLRPPLAEENVEVDPRSPPRAIALERVGANSDVPDIQARLLLSLSSGDYEAAVNEYTEAYAISTVDENAGYRDLLIAHASNLINDEQSDRAIELLGNYVAVFYADADALVMLGRAYRNAGLSHDAIRAFQQAYRNEHRSGVAYHILVQQNNEIGKLVQELKEQNNYGAITDLYEDLTQSQPDVPGYFIALANAHLAQQHRAQALRSLDYVKHDAKVGPQARAMMAELLGQAAQDPN